jgi:flagella basal body P-ring formation protein FlgA
MTPTTRLALLFALLLAIGARADTITLKRSVTIAPDTPVTLGMIADLDGAHAQRLGMLVITESPDTLPRQNPGEAGAPPRWTLDLGSVRAAIEADPSVNWAFLTLRGRDLTLIGPDRRPLSETAPTPHSDEPTDRPEEGITVFDEGTVGHFARGVVRSILRVRDDDLRIVWNTRDAELLGEPVGERTVHVQRIGSSDRMPLEVTIYKGDRIERTETVRADITVRRRVHVLARPLHREAPITPADFTTRESWIGPGVEPAPEVQGRVASRRLEAGMIIEIADITPPLVVERGELITLHCISGAVAIRSPARALADAREGETVAVEMEGTGRRVLARMNERGHAVLVVRADVPATASPGTETIIRGETR